MLYWKFDIKYNLQNQFWWLFLYWTLDKPKKCESQNILKQSRKNCIQVKGDMSPRAPLISPWNWENRSICSWTAYPKTFYSSSHLTFMKADP